MTIATTKRMGVGYALLRHAPRGLLDRLVLARSRRMGYTSA